MIHPQNYKVVQVIEPKDCNGTDPTSNAIDTAGFDYAWFILATGTVASAFSAAPSLTECDTSGGTYTAITSSALATAPAATDDNKNFAWYIDLRNRKRYLKISVDVAASGATNLCVLGILSRAEVTPTSASERGLSQQVILPA